LRPRQNLYDRRFRRDLGIKQFAGELLVACRMFGRRNQIGRGAATGQIFTSGPPLPSLSIVPSGTNLTLTWPSGTGLFQLQQRSNLTTAACTDATNSVSTTNGQSQVTVSRSANRAFYQLRGQ
jgi:hypothetical protein